MAALVAPGAPVSVLIDYGLGDKLAEKLVESGIVTVEKLGSMTPEELEEIQGIGPKMVEKIQLAVNAYYAQFDESGEAGIAAEGEAALTAENEAGLPAENEAAAEQPAAEESLEASEDAGLDEQISAEETVDSPDLKASESDTMEDINSSAHSLDEKGEVHES